MCCRIFNVPRNGPQAIGIASKASPSSKSSKPIGAIVGGSVGGAALLLLIAFGIFFLRMMRNKRHQSGDPAVDITEAEETKPPLQGWQVEPFTMGSPNSQYGFQNQALQSPSSSHHVLSTPMTSPHSMIFEDPAGMGIAPPSYQPPQAYHSGMPAEKASAATHAV